MSERRRPDYHVVASHKVSEDRWANTRVGAAWEAGDGRISIRLEPGIAVSTPQGVSLTLLRPRQDGGEA